MIEKKEKKTVDFDTPNIIYEPSRPDATDVQESWDETIQFVDRAIQDYRSKAKRHSVERNAIDKIGEAFNRYLLKVSELDNTHNKHSFPTITRDKDNKIIPRSIDKRLVVLVILLKNLSDISGINKAVLPEKYGNHNLDFTTRGWPVIADAENTNEPFVLAWQTLARDAAIEYTAVITDAELSRWAGDYTRQEHLTTVNNKIELSQDINAQDINAQDIGAQDIGAQLVEPNQTAAHIALDIPEEQHPLIESEHFNFNEWQAPNVLHELINCLKEMYHYGYSLKYQSAEKSDVVRDLAVQLFKDLKAHYESGSNLNRVTHNNFMEQFKTDLHSQDELMNTHRKYWKVVVANIALSFTVIGALAVGISLLTRRHGFFNKTECQQRVDDIDEKVKDYCDTMESILI